MNKVSLSNRVFYHSRAALSGVGIIGLALGVLGVIGIFVLHQVYAAAFSVAWSLVLFVSILRNGLVVGENFLQLSRFVIFNRKILFKDVEACAFYSKIISSTVYIVIYDVVSKRRVATISSEYFSEADVYDIYDLLRARGVNFREGGVLPI